MAKSSNQLQNLYDLLGVPTSATQKDIQKAYARISAQARLDMRGSGKPNKKFLEIFDAYQVLTSRKKRENYDVYLRYLELSGSHDDFEPGKNYAAMVADLERSGAGERKDSSSKATGTGASRQGGGKIKIPPPILGEPTFDEEGHRVDDEDAMDTPTRSEWRSSGISAPKDELHEDGTVDPLGGSGDIPAPNLGESGVFFDPEFFENSDPTASDSFSPKQTRDSLEETGDFDISFDPTWVDDHDDSAHERGRSSNRGMSRDSVHSSMLQGSGSDQGFDESDDASVSIGYYLRDQQQPLTPQGTIGGNLDSAELSTRLQPPGKRKSQAGEDDGGKKRLTESQVLVKIRDYAAQGILALNRKDMNRGHTVFRKIAGYLRLILQRKDKSELRQKLTKTGWESIERAGEDCLTGLKHLKGGRFDQALRAFRWVQRYLQIAADEIGQASGPLRNPLQELEKPQTPPPPAAAPAAPPPRQRPVAREKAEANMSPDQRMAHEAYLKALAAIKQRDYKKAITHFKWAIDLVPDNPTYKSRMAGLLALMDRDLRVAKKYAQEAVELAPDNPASHYYLGIVYRAVGLKSRARKSLEKSLSLDPSHQGAKNVLQKLLSDET